MLYGRYLLIRASLFCLIIVKINSRRKYLVFVTFDKIIIAFKMGYQNNEVLKNNSLYERVKKLLISYEWSDCNFLVRGKKFKAHKLILGISSPVFEAMLYGPLSTNEDITITDIEPNTFQLLLNYLYTDKVDLGSIEEAYDLLYVSSKYMLEYLSEMCVNYIDKSMSIDNVISILNYPEHLQNNQLTLSAQKLACQHASFLLKDQKQNISLTCIKKILESNNINISEKDLIMSVFEWTLYYCEQNDIPQTLDNRRDVFIKSGLHKMLRFHLLSNAEWSEILNSEHNLLSNCEFNNMCNGKIFSEKLNDILTIRKPLEFVWNLCLRSPIRSESPLVIGLHNHTIYTKLKTNKSMFVKSLNLQSQTAPMYSNANPVAHTEYFEQITVSITCEADNSIINVSNFLKPLRYDTNFDIEFLNPILLKRDLWYKVCFQWPKTYRFTQPTYAVQSRDRSYNNGIVKIEFEDISHLSDTGSFLRGLKYCM